MDRQDPTQMLTQNSNNKTVLPDRILWYDGSITLTPEKINEYLLSGKSVNDKIYVTEINAEIEKFNKLNGKKLDIKTELAELDRSWNIPDSFKTLNVDEFVYDKLLEEHEKSTLTTEQLSLRFSRVEQELQLYSKYNIVGILKTLIFVVSTFKHNNVVWGTGRGSSCSSYILYLIGLHDVDSVEYELDINEFFR